MVCIGTDTVLGVQGTGGIIVLAGVLFSSYAVEVILAGVVNGVMLLVTVFWKFPSCFLFRSSETLSACAFDDSEEDIGEKGLRVLGISTSLALLVALKECFLTGRPSMSKPLLPEMKSKEHMNW